MDWTETYRPESLDEVRGNDSACTDLLEWAQSWDEHGDAAILYGRPGIGKTSAAHALADDMGWETIEMNASEQRTKAVVNKVAGGAANNGTLTGGTTGRRLVILDEADSLHGNADRGGSGAITTIVKEASQPVVLIANDFYELSRSVRNNCEDIEFSTGNISASEVAQFLRDICEAEDVEYTTEAIKALAKKNSDDIRGAVNDLQAVVTRVDEELTADDVPTSERDSEEELFDFLDAVLKEDRPRDVHEAAMDVDETPDDLFAWIEDNAVKALDTGELVDAYESLARADEWLGRVRQTQNYQFWRYVNDQITAGVAASRNGRKGGWTRFGPPGYWQKLGRTKGTRKKRDHIARHIAQRSSVSMETARQDVMPFLSSITHHCKNREATVAMTAMYDLNEKHVSFITGSGKDTNKVGSIVEDAEEKRAEEALENSRGAFDQFDTDNPDNARADDSERDNGQVALDIGGDEPVEESVSDTDSTSDEPTNSNDETETADTSDSQKGLGDFV